MIQNKKAFVFKTDLNYKQSIYLLDKILSENKPVCLFVYSDKNSCNMYYKMLSIIKKHYNKQIFDKQLIFQKYNNLNTDLETLLKVYSYLILSFDEFILLDPKHLYLPNFVKKISENTDQDFDIKIFEPFQNITPDHKFSQNSNKCIYSISKKILTELLPINNIEDILKLNNIKVVKHRENTILYNTYNSDNKAEVLEDHFKLLYLKEKSSKRKSSYCFFYEKNKKCMNIDNDIAGKYNFFSDSDVHIDWDNKNMETAIYRKNEEDNIYYEQC